MNFQEFATSTFGTNLWMALGRLPPRAGHALARGMTGVLYRRKSAIIYRTLYANQKVVLGEAATPEQVDLAVAAVLRHAGMTAFDLVHAVAGGEEGIVRSIELPAGFWADLEAGCTGGRGVLVCGCHLSNFNLGFLKFALQGNVQIQVLSAPMAAGGFHLLTELRNRGYFEETPIDASALRKALVRLRQGGVALIGVDWPVGAQPGELVPFFGRPARLSTGYIRLAMSANAAIMPLACRWSAERGYYAMTKPPLLMERTGDRERDISHNARRVLSVIEDWIRETPDQWLMYHPVWPEDE